MNGPWDTAALLMLFGLLAWRLASVLLRAAGVLALWLAVIEIVTAAGLPADAGALALGTCAWFAGRWLDGLVREPLAELLAMRRRSRRGR